MPKHYPEDSVQRKARQTAVDTQAHVLEQRAMDDERLEQVARDKANWESSQKFNSEQGRARQSAMDIQAHVLGQRAMAEGRAEQSARDKANHGSSQKSGGSNNK
ncbi:uncharacterized protein KGF55_005160 [Candida pseudojiufengensis]|uniref:uncharacterized protein n=1 Tax=Candida pseudojiufengensis TaxID=497109 RepID=UPI002224B5D3|nr:uncharacterized protein KGF55_005160 [Candida pseudojiufengensis]KAI5959928.1 hypothetical protein KGF55_005160 [Candida pseudojiufengensis]